MKIRITYIPISYYDRTTISQWVFLFRRHNLTKGFIMRIFGIYISLSEKNATEKLIEINRKRFDVK